MQQIGLCEARRGSSGPNSCKNISIHSLPQIAIHQSTAANHFVFLLSFYNAVLLNRRLNELINFKSKQHQQPQSFSANLYVDASEFRAAAAASSVSSSSDIDRRRKPWRISDRISASKPKQEASNQPPLVLATTSARFAGNLMNKCCGIDDCSFINKPSSRLSSSASAIWFCHCKPALVEREQASFYEPRTFNPVSTKRPLSLFCPPDYSEMTTTTTTSATSNHNQHNYDELFLNNDEEADLKFEDDHLIGTVYSSSSSSLSCSSNKYQTCSTSSINPPSTSKPCLNQQPQRSLSFNLNLVLNNWSSFCFRNLRL